MKVSAKKIFGILPLSACLMVLLYATCAQAQTSASSISPAGVTTNFAQTLAWLDNAHFVLGRWDGTVSVFRTPGTNEYGPVIVDAMAPPSGAGVEMVAALGPSSFVSSDGRDALALWKLDTASGASGHFVLAARLPYKSEYGPANSGLMITVNQASYLLTGHESGQVLLWSLDKLGNLNLSNIFDLKSPQPPSNPWGLRNIRGIAKWHDDSVVTGSEDGDLVGLQIPSGKELFRYRYNDKAQRGINNISLVNDHLLVANCSVGADDKNIWLYDIASGSPKLVDAANLEIDAFRSQVFDFDADLAPSKSGLSFFSSTEEGVMWEGSASQSKLVVTGVTKSSDEGGSIMGISPDGHLIAVATHTIRLFNVPQ